MKLPGSSAFWGQYIVRTGDFHRPSRLTWMVIEQFNLAAFLDFPNGSNHEMSHFAGAVGVKKKFSYHSTDASFTM